jgi:TctA family transporter
MGAFSLVRSLHTCIQQQAKSGTFFISRGLSRDIREARERDEQVERYRQASIKIKERRRIVKLLSVNVPLGVMIGVLPVLGKFISSVVFLVSWL